MSWAPAGPELYRLREGSAPASPAVADSGLSSLATPSGLSASQAKFLSLDNPLTAFAVIAALTFGAMAFSTSGTVRIGKTTATAGLGVGSTK